MSLRVPTMAVVETRPEALGVEMAGLKRIMRWHFLGRNHTEHWKAFRRGGNGPEGHTVGFEWFATWPSTSRLRLPFGRRETLATILAGWIATSSQVKRGTLTEECAMVERDRLGHEAIDEKDSTKREWVKGREYNRDGVILFLHLRKRLTMKANPRRGWRPDGTEITA